LAIPTWEEIKLDGEGWRVYYFEWVLNGRNSFF